MHPFDPGTYNATSNDPRARLMEDMYGPEWGQRLMRGLGTSSTYDRSSPESELPRSQLSKAIRGEPDYGEFASGGQLVSRRPMIGGGGYIETSAPSDPRSLANQWARGMGRERDRQIEQLIPAAAQHVGQVMEGQREAARSRSIANQEALKTGLERLKFDYAVSSGAARKVDEMEATGQIKPEQAALLRARIKEDPFAIEASRRMAPSQVVSNAPIGEAGAVAPASAADILQTMQGAKQATPTGYLRQILEQRGEDWARQNWPAIKQQLAQRPGGIESIRSELSPSVIGNTLSQTGQAIMALNPWATSNWWTPEGRQNLRSLVRTPISQSLSRALRTPVLGEDIGPAARRLLGM